MTTDWKGLCNPVLLGFLQQDTDCCLAFRSNEPSGSGEVDESGSRKRSREERVLVPVLPCHALVLRLHSAPLREALAIEKAATPAQPAILTVGDESELPGWVEALSFLYRANPPSGMTWTSVAKMLPIVHKYDLRSLMDECRAWLLAHVQGVGSDAQEDSYILKWLCAAERYHMDDVQAAVLALFLSVLQHTDMADVRAMLKDKAHLAQLAPETLATMMGMTADGGARYVCDTMQCTAATFRTYGSMSHCRNLVCNHGYMVSGVDYNTDEEITAGDMVLEKHAEH